MVGGIAFGASDCISEARDSDPTAYRKPDIFDEPVEVKKSENEEHLTQQLRNLRAMHDQDVIDSDEFKELKTVLLQKLKACY